jgi:hypothetical protein
MKKTLIIILIVLSVIIGSYFLFFHMTKNKALDIIVQAKPGRTPGDFSGFDTDFLIAWARAIKRSSPDFTVNGKIYSTDTAKGK